MENVASVFQVNDQINPISATGVKHRCLGEPWAGAWLVRCGGRAGLPRALLPPLLRQCPAALGIHHGHSDHRALWAVTLKFLLCPSNVRDITRIRFPLNYTIAKGYNCIKHIMLLP